MPRETKEERKRRIDKTTRELVKKFTPSTEEIIDDVNKQIAKQIIPFDGGRAIGDLTRAEAVEYSQKLVALAHWLNVAAPGLPEARPLRRKSDKAAAVSPRQRAQLSSHSDFIDDEEDRNPSGVYRSR